MQSPRLAGRYAKSLIDLADEKGQLETVLQDMQYMKKALKESREFYVLMKSPIIKADKKLAILEAATSGRVSEMTAGFNRLVVKKGRESKLPEIVNAFIEQYNEMKGIHKVKLTTAVEVSAAMKTTIMNKLITEAKLGTIQLETKVNPALIGGFVLEFNNNKVDASILRDLNDVKKQFMDNEYVLKIR